MNILSWNIRGAVNLAGRRVLKELASKHSLDIVIILEPHCQFDKVSRFWDRMGYLPMAISEANGHSGGIWVLGLKGRIQFSVLDIFPQVVSLKIGEGTNAWICSAVYGCPIPSRRDELWDHLVILRRQFSLPWMLLGDFNEIILLLEVKGGEFSFRRAKNFADVIDACNLMDVGSTGNLFTWSRTVQGR